MLLFTPVHPSVHNQLLLIFLIFELLLSSRHGLAFPVTHQSASVKHSALKNKIKKRTPLPSPNTWLLLVGALVGCTVGIAVGCTDGTPVGINVGISEGCIVGFTKRFKKKCAIYCEQDF